MSVQRKDLEAAAQNGLLGNDQIEPLFQFLVQLDNSSGKSKFSGIHILYYLGGLLAIGAASLFATLAVESLGMGALFGLSVLYAGACIAVASWFEKKHFGVPAAIFATLAIALTPLAVFALQHVLGFWGDDYGAEHYRDYHAYINWRWLLMELSTLATGALMLYRFRYTFLVMPIAITLWYMGMDIIPALILNTGVDDSGYFYGNSWELRVRITLAYGLIMILMALIVDLRSRHSKDYAFWLYVFGIMTFWGALSSMGSGQLSGKLIYLAINIVMIFVGGALSRRVFAVFGGLGTAMVLGNLSWGIFKDSFAFVVVLTLGGFALIAAGIWWSKHEASITQRLRSWLPNDLRELLEARQS